MERINFTQSRIRSLQPPDKGRLEVWDKTYRYLMLRVTANGVKTFCLYVYHNGKQRRVTLGRFPAVSVANARNLAEEAMLQLKQGKDPLTERKRLDSQAMTLRQLMESYIDMKGDNLKSSTIFDYRKNMRQGFSDWLDKPARSITRDNVTSRRNKLTRKDQNMRVLRAILKHGVHRRILIENPVDVLTESSLWAKPKRKTRKITRPQLNIWYQSVLGLDQQNKTLLLLLLYTGLRAGEGVSLRWEDVDLKTGKILLRDTKNSTDFITFMPRPVFGEVAILPRRGVYVFPGRSGHMAIPRHSIKKVIAETGIEFSCHDLRRTFATICEAAGLPETLIKRLLNHDTDSDVTGGYIQTESGTIESGIEKVFRHIQGILEEPIDISRN